MKPVFFNTAALPLVAALSIAPAMAQSSKSSPITNSIGIERPAMPATASVAPHWEYRYGYDRRAAWRGHWVLVR